MNRNKENELIEISEVLSKMATQKEIADFLKEVLTTTEISTLSKRWRILKMLLEGEVQRDISKDLNVSLCKVTRGARVLKNENSIVRKYLIKEENYENIKNTATTEQQGFLRELRRKIFTR